MASAHAHQPAHGHIPDDPTDPHGDLGHHGHVIIPVSTLLGVLIVLLVFTFATVAASRAEVWIAARFAIEIPQWVNVGVALSIAVVKSALVAAFFMQLKYDSRMNMLVFLFCVFALGLFLFISMTDLGMRAIVYPWKASDVSRGGTTNKFVWGGTVIDPATGQAGSTLIVGPVAEFARQKFIERVGPEQYAVIEQDAKGHGTHDDHAAPTPPSTAGRSRPVRGLTNALHVDPGAHAPDPAHFGGH